MSSPNRKSKKSVGLTKKGKGSKGKSKKTAKQMFRKRGKIAKPSKKSVGVTLYKRLPVPGTGKFVTIKSEDINNSINIFYDKKMLKIKTSDIIKMTNMRTIPDMINILKTYKLNM